MIYYRVCVSKKKFLSILFVLGTERDIMHNLNKNDKNKNNTIATAAKVFSLPTILVVAIVGVTIIPPLTAQAFIDPTMDERQPKAPMAASEDGNNVYVVWWTNRSGNWEVMFRASNDGGQTFGDRINLSNSSDAESQTAEILAVGESNVFVSWWETNPMNGTSESVMRVSTDAGQTFGPMIMLGTNGTISSTEEEGGGEETVEEEAVGGEEVAQ
jgi:hypothetical protein